MTGPFWFALVAWLIMAGVAQWYRVRAINAEQWVWLIVSEVEKALEEDEESEA